MCKTLALFIALSSTLALSAFPQSVRYRDEIFPSVDLSSNLAYGSAFNTTSGQTQTLLLDIYEPTGDTALARPAVVVVHGGGFVSGSKTAGQIVALAEAFARRGYVAVSISYRLTSLALFPQNLAAAVEDAKNDFKASVRYLRAMATTLRIDPTRIAAIGSSAGAFTVLAGAYVPGEGTSGNPGFSSEISALVSLWGALLDPSQIDPSEPPPQLVHGTADFLVPYLSSILIHQQAQSVGLASELIPLTGLGHAPWGTYLSTYLFDAAAFFYEHLRLGQQSGLGATPGFSAPGSLTVTSTGIAGDLRFVAAAPAPGFLFLGDLGTLCLDIPSSASGYLAPFPTTSSRLPVESMTFSIPSQAAGTTFYVQELHITPLGSPRLLTNCMVLPF